MNDKGFSYLAVLILIVVSGIALSGAGKYRHTVMKQERETELLFRGDRIRRAIASYVKKGDGSYPKRMDDLLRDPRFPGILRHIRKIYPDPMTAEGEWEYLREAGGGIRGIHSKSEKKPLKSGNFPRDYLFFEGAQKYSDWQFVYISLSAKKTQSAKKEE